VQQRIALAGGPVIKPHRQQPLAVDMLDTAMATAGPHMLVQVGHRLSQPSMMRFEHRPAGHRVAKAVQD
jgi:hypothetical protein